MIAESPKRLQTGENPNKLSINRNSLVSINESAHRNSFYEKMRSSFNEVEEDNISTSFKSFNFSNNNKKAPQENNYPNFVYFPCEERMSNKSSFDNDEEIDSSSSLDQDISKVNENSTTLANTSASYKELLLNYKETYENLQKLDLNNMKHIDIELDSNLSLNLGLDFKYARNNLQNFINGQKICNSNSKNHEGKSYDFMPEKIKLFKNENSNLNRIIRKEFKMVKPMLNELVIRSDELKKKLLKKRLLFMEKKMKKIASMRRRLI